MPECGLEMQRVCNISFLKTRLLRMIADARKKMTLWGRTAAYEGGPSVCANKTKTGQQAGDEPRDPRARSAEGGSSRGPNFGFGSGTSRFTVIQSSPASPMVDNMPMFWTVRDIDIGRDRNRERHRHETDTDIWTKMIWRKIEQSMSKKRIA